VALLAGFSFVFSIQLTSQTFSPLYSINSSEGIRPFAGLVCSGNTLYGTTIGGGTDNDGTVFRINIDGTGFTTLYNFSGVGNLQETNSDGANPWATLILSNDILYGTANEGGMGSSGTLFSVSTNGSDFNTTHSFTPFWYPVFVTNSDGANPQAHLTLSGHTLYGTTTWGGSSGDGVVFSVQTDGSDFSVLHHFVISDGAIPRTGVIVCSNVLYGGTYNGVNGYPNEGSGPNGLVLLERTLYGTTFSGGISNVGTVFAVNTDGSAFTTLHSFSGGCDGSYPTGIILSSNTLYGTTITGGDSTAYYNGGYGNGTIFSISFPPRLTIVPSGSKIILSWPTNYFGFDYAGYSLQSTTNLALPVWSTNLPAPVVVNGQYTVTNPISGTQQFFRLSQ